MQAFPIPKKNKVIFDVIRKNKVIGSHEIVFSEKDDYIYMGGEFHEDIKFVHFTHRLNKPHLWEDYKEFIKL